VIAAAGVISAVVVAGVAGGLGGDGDAPKPIVTDSSLTMAPPSTGLPPATQAIMSVSTESTVITTNLSQPLGYGSAGEPVSDLQERLTELGFFPGPVDGQFGGLTEKAVWAFEKLVMQVPRGEPTGIVTDEMWQFMQQPIEIQPRRKYSAGEATENHTEVYLPEQVVVFFVNDEAVLISHASSGTGEEWKQEVTIDVGEYGNENGTEPSKRGEIGVSITPGGVFEYDRMIDGLRESALGTLWNPAYFNYGIAIHGALNVPLQPASHGCIRLPMAIGEVFQQYVAVDDQVFVWDGVKEPEFYGEQVPIFNRIDPDYSTTTTTTTTSTTAPAAAAPATTGPTTTHTPHETQPATTTTELPGTTDPSTTPAGSTTIAPS